ncbi:MAG: hypothetical protein AAB336_14155 [Acidobacteriota bacterium]
MKIYYQEIEGIPNSQILEKIAEFYQSIFAVTDSEKLHNRINSAKSLFTLLEFSDGEIVGFKLGYQIDSVKFYSWIGGVNRFNSQALPVWLKIWRKKTLLIPLRILKFG